MLYYSEDTNKRYNINTLKRAGKTPADDDVFELIINKPEYDETRYFLQDTGEVQKVNNHYEIVYEQIAYSDEVAQEKIKAKKDSYYEKLLKLYEEKEKGAREVITGIPTNEALMKEYERKQKALNENNVDFFADEAEVNGTTAQEEFDRAMQVAQFYNQAYDHYMGLMASFRRGVGKYIEEENWKKVEWLLEQGKELKKDVQIQDIKELLK